MKRQKRCTIPVFDWLSTEVIVMILEFVPWELDRITRIVCHRWSNAINHRWDPKRNLAENYGPSCYRSNVCVVWALHHNAFNFLKTMLYDMKIVPTKIRNKARWMEIACCIGNKKTIAWLVSLEAPVEIRSCHPSEYHLHDAVKHGLECFQLVLGLTHNQLPKGDMVMAASGGGDLELVKWILTTYGGREAFYQPTFEYCVEWACRGGHIGMVDWWLSKPKLTDTCFHCWDIASKYISEALDVRRIKLAKHLYYEWGCLVDDVLVLNAIQFQDNTEVMEWILDIVTTTDKIDFGYVVELFIRKRHFDLLNKLDIKGLVGISTWLFTVAVTGDKYDLKMLKWLWQRCDKDEVEGTIVAYNLRRIFPTDDNPKYESSKHRVVGMEVMCWLQCHDMVEYVLH